MNTKNCFFTFLFLSLITPVCAFQVQSSGEADASKPSRYRAPGASGVVETRPVTTRTMGTYGSRQKWSRSAVSTQGVQTSVAGSRPEAKEALPAGDYGVAESPDLTLPAKNTNARGTNAPFVKKAAASPSVPDSNAPVAASAPQAAVPAAGDSPRVPAEAAAALKQAQDMAKQMGVQIPELDALSAGGMAGMMGGGADASASAAVKSQPAANANKSDKMFGNFGEFKKVK